MEKATYTSIIGETYALHTSSIDIPLILAITCATCDIVAGSFLPLIMRPFSHFSFLTALGKGGAALLCLADA